MLFLNLKNRLLHAAHLLLRHTWLHCSSLFFHLPGLPALSYQTLFFRCNHFTRCATKIFYSQPCSLQSSSFGVNCCSLHSLTAGLDLLLSSPRSIMSRRRQCWDYINISHDEDPKYSITALKALEPQQL